MLTYSARSSLGFRVQLRSIYATQFFGEDPKVRIKATNKGTTMGRVNDKHLLLPVSPKRRKSASILRAAAGDFGKSDIRNTGTRH